MRKLTVNHTPTLPTRGNKTAASLRTRIAALLTLSAALLAATTLGGATPASAENAPVITVQYKNFGFYNGNLLLLNAKPANNENVNPLGFPGGDACLCNAGTFDNPILQKFVFEAGGKAKVKACAQAGTCETLEVPINSDTKSLCFETTGTTFLGFDLYQIACGSNHHRIAG